MPARIAQAAHLQGVTQARFRCAAAGYRGKICGIQRVVADNLVFGIGQGQERVALFLRHRYSCRHLIPFKKLLAF
jgi:hypothetical protein